MTFTTKLASTIEEITHPASLNPELSQIDRDICLHEQAVRDLKSRRNALAFVSMLPPEILSKIFLFLAFPRHYPDGKQALSWIKVSHVCRHWRAVALSYPTLWSAPAFFSANWAPEMLRRSKMAPLTIRADLTFMTPKMVEWVTKAVRQLHRTTDLLLTGHSPHLDKILQSLDHPAPFLQTLVITNAKEHFYYLQEGQYTLPSNLFAGHAPRLRHLEIIKCSLPWSSGLYSATLTHLKLTHPGKHGRPGMPDLIDSLEKMRNLETLDLEQALPVVPHGAKYVPAALRVISLPKLTHLRLGGAMLECAHLLSHLTFPTSCTIHIICSSIDGDFSGILPSLSTIFSSSKHPRTLAILHAQPSGVRLKVWPTSDETAAQPSARPTHDLELSWASYGTRKFESVITSVCKALPLQNIRTLHISQMETLSSEAWLSNFARLPRLRAIYLKGLSGHELVRALGTVDVAAAEEKKNRGIRARRNNRNRPPPMHFPALRTLSFNDVDFDSPSSYYGMWLDDLLDTLIMRYEHKVELYELHLQACANLFARDVSLLEEVVAEVQWDEVIIYPSDEYGDEYDGTSNNDSDDYYGGGIFGGFVGSEVDYDEVLFF